MGASGLLAAAEAASKTVSVRDLNDALVRAYVRADALEERFIRVLEPILKRAGVQAARTFRSQVTDHMTAAGWTPPARQEIVDVDALVAELRTKTDPVRVAMVEQSMTPALKAAGLSFDVTNPFTKSVLAQSGSQITNIAETTQLNVMRIVKASYENGLSIPDTATAIQGGMEEAATTRATLIARTELAGAVNGGSLAATRIVADETGMKLKKTWLTAEGAMYPRHEEYEGLDGQTVELEALFEVGGDQLDYPGDPSGSPEEVCNCRCTLVYADSSGDEQEAEGGDAPTLDMGGGDAAAVDEGATVEPNPDFADAGSLVVPPEFPDSTREAVADAQTAIETVMPIFKDIPIEPLPDSDTSTARALINGKTNGGSAIGFHVREGYAPKINDIVHEYGHIVDRDLWGQSFDEEVIAPTDRYGSELSSNEAGSLWQTMRNTPTMQALKDGVYDEENGGLLTSQERNYYLSGREMFARAYEQYIAEQSGNKAMLKQIDSVLSWKGKLGDLSFQYWPHDEFAPIKARMDRIFEERGLVVPKLLEKGAPVFDTNPYLASLQKEKYTTGNKLGKLEHRLRSGEKGSLEDVARAKALRAHRDELSKLLSDKSLTPEEMRTKEEAYLTRALADANKTLNEPPVAAKAPTVFTGGKLEEHDVMPAMDHALLDMGKEVSPESDEEYRDAYKKLQDEVDAGFKEAPPGAAHEAYEAITRVGAENVTVLRDDSGKMLGVVDFNTGIDVAEAEDEIGYLDAAIERDTYQDDRWAGTAEEQRQSDIDLRAKLQELIERKKSSTEIGVNHLASTGVSPGIGARLMQEVAKVAAAQGKGVGLNSLSEAEGFYKRLGMTQEPGTHNYHWTAEQAKAFAEGKLDTLATDAERPQRIADATATKELVTARTKDLDNLDTTVVPPPAPLIPPLVMDVPMPSPEVVTAPLTQQASGELSADIAAIKGSASWTPRGAFDNNEPLTSVQEAQFNALQRAGERMQETIMADPAYVQAQQTFEEVRDRWQAALDNGNALRAERDELLYANKLTDRADVLAWDDKLTKAREKLIGLNQAKKDAEGAMFVARRQATIKTLEQVRKVGAGYTPTDKVKFMASGKQDAKTQEGLTYAQKWIPRDWLSKTRELQTTWGDRGYHVSGNFRQNAHIQISSGRDLNPAIRRGMPPGANVALHELMHEVEATNSMVLDAEATFYKYRTSGSSFTGRQEKLVTMRKATGNSGYAADEVTREDKFSNAYIGRWYGVSAAGPSQAFEVLSMGVEGVINGTIEMDEEYTRFILGVMAML